MNAKFCRNFAIFWLLIVFSVFAMFLVGCKTKHKITERERIKQETKTEENASVLKQNDVVSNIDTHIINNSFKIDSESIIKLTQANPEASIIIENEKGEKLKVTGANVDISKKETTETKKDTAFQKESKIDKSVSNSNKASKKETTSESQKRNSDSLVKTTSTWFWIVLFGVLSIAILAYFYFYKK